jgi:hypothetical protein
MELVVDAYGPEEQAMGLYYQLADTMQVGNQKPARV